MARKEPLYPHVTKSRKPGTETPSPGHGARLRFLPDSPEFLAETINCTGCRDKLERVFQQAIARVKGGK